MESIHNKRREDELRVEEEAGMKSRLSRAVRAAGAQAAKSRGELEQLKTTVTEAVSGTFEDGVRRAKRVSKAGLAVAEDFVDEATYRIKRQPMRSVGITLAIGFAFGTLVGWSAFRRGRVAPKGN